MRSVSVCSAVHAPFRPEQGWNAAPRSLHFTDICHAWQLIKIHRSPRSVARRPMDAWHGAAAKFFLSDFRSIGGGHSGKRTLWRASQRSSRCEQGAPVSGFINRSLSLLSAGIPFPFPRPLDPRFLKIQHEIFVTVPKFCKQSRSVI